MEDDVVTQIRNRIKTLLFDEKVQSHHAHETFRSTSNRYYQFLIWKHRPDNIGDFCKQIQSLIHQEGYQCIPGAWDVSTYNPNTKTGYKVVALYKETAKVEESA